MVPMLFCLATIVLVWEQAGTGTSRTICMRVVSTVSTGTHKARYHRNHKITCRKTKQKYWQSWVALGAVASAAWLRTRHAGSKQGSCSLPFVLPSDSHHQEAICKHKESMGSGLRLVDARRFGCRVLMQAMCCPGYRWPTRVALHIIVFASVRRALRQYTCESRSTGQPSGSRQGVNQSDIAMALRSLWHGSHIRAMYARI